MKILLINSSVPRVGKTTFSTQLQQKYKGIKHLAFAQPIKDISIELANTLYCHTQTDNPAFVSYSSTNKDKPIGGEVFGNTTPRELVCDVSNLITKVTHKDIWGSVALSGIRQAELEGFKVCIFDDWRRPQEAEFLRSQSDLEVTSLYLQKEDVTYEATSDSVASFEGKISPDDCDISWIFDKSWDNTEELNNMLSICVGLSCND